MKEILIDYTKYNVWANRIIIEVLLTIPKEKWDLELGGSFGTLRKTVYHLFGAESIWMQRIEMKENPEFPTPDLDTDITKVCKEWQDISLKLHAFVEKQYDDRAFAHEFIYKSIKKDIFKNRVYDVIHHCMNHSSFHRGQLVHMARELGVTKIPSTDYITFCREKK